MQSAQFWTWYGRERENMNMNDYRWQTFQAVISAEFNGRATTALALLKLKLRALKRCGAHLCVIARTTMNTDE